LGSGAKEAPSSRKKTTLSTISCSI
jgi:hypothetical protein